MKQVPASSHAVSILHGALMGKTGDLYKHVLDNLHDGVYFVDRDRRIPPLHRFPITNPQSAISNQQSQEITPFL